MRKIAIVLFAFTWFVSSPTVFAYPFNPQTPTILAGDMHLVESADFNADGKNDLVVTDGKVYRGIAILYGNGNGTFQAPLVLGDMSGYEWGLVIGDIDSDGDIDIVVGNSSLRQLQIYKNTGSGNRFTGAFDIVAVNNPDGTRQADVTLADMNNDSNLDVIIGTENTTAFEVYLNDGSGNFAYSTGGGTGSGHGGKGSTAYDYTNDGWKDIIIADENLSQIQFYRNDGAGLFSTLDYSVSVANPYDVKIADFDIDGNPELIFTSPVNGLSMTSLDGLTLHANYPGQAYYTKIYDFDGDNNLDILWSDNAVTGIHVALGNGDLTFDTPVSYAVNFSPLGVAVNDFDGDTLLDVAAVNHGDTLSIFLTQTLPQTASVWVNPTPILATTNETGPVATTFQIGLDSEPTDIVEIAFTNSDGQLILTKDGNPVSGVCFVPSNISVTPGVSPYEPCSRWNLGQEITVTPVVDGLTEGTHTSVVKFTAITSPDNNYATLSVPANLTATIIDENDSTVPAVTTVRIFGPSGTDPNFTALMGTDTVTLTFFSDEFIDLTTSMVTIGGVTATCVAPVSLSDAYKCTVPAASLVGLTIYGQLNNIEVTVKDGSGNTASTITQTTDGTSVQVIPVTPVDTVPPTLTLATALTSVKGPFVVTITPSEIITGLILSDLIITNGVASNLIGPDGSGNYTVTITPIASGLITIQIPVSSVVDGVNNPNTLASNLLSVDYKPQTSTIGGWAPLPVIALPSVISKDMPDQQNKDGLCKPLLVEDIILGHQNNPEEVKKLEKFLNQYQNEVLSVNGIYEQADYDAAKRFQSKYMREVITPWGGKAATGIVSVYTRAKINALYCAHTYGCPYFDQYSMRGDTGGQISRIQNFLNIFTGSKLVENGIFDNPTYAAVQKYQVLYQDQVLTPWGLSHPTGRWYQSTRNLANSAVGCPEGETLLDNGNKVNN